MIFLGSSLSVNRGKIYSGSGALKYMYVSVCFAILGIGRRLDNILSVFIRLIVMQIDCRFKYKLG